MPVKRQLKVAELLKHDISEIIHDDIRDPGVGMPSITRVLVSSDLKVAKIYLSVLGDEKSRKASFKVLERASQFIRLALGHRGGYRYIPELRFYYDDTLDYVFSIEDLLKKAREKDGPPKE